MIGRGGRAGPLPRRPRGGGGGGERKTWWAFVGEHVNETMRWRPSSMV
jgi:hypothetical protein